MRKAQKKKVDEEMKLELAKNTSGVSEGAASTVHVDAIVNDVDADRKE